MLRYLLVEGGAMTREVEEGEEATEVFCSWSCGSKEEGDERGIGLRESEEGSGGHGGARGSCAGSRGCRRRQSKRQWRGRAERLGQRERLRSSLIPRLGEE
ncbi:hypothetical protein B296_00057792 [Ensete ventricosum]|uniref:Uncharacterized protein n=1 Tax=Ensete ventricosum TaxID=4639 RepID=A0A426X7N8_ENSVE|nr:hypothetical protein B296_00057792 [Ensete ventricosum]